MKNPKPRSPSKIEEYKYSAKIIIRKILIEEKAHSLTQIDLCVIPRWLAKMQSQLTKSTFRQYRAALRYQLQLIGTSNAALAIEMLDKLTSANYPKHSNKTSSNTRKQFPTRDIQRYDSWLEKHIQLKWSALVRSWLQCTVLTGLRPIEWSNAILVSTPGWEEEPILWVMNAKVDAERGNGNYRTLQLGSLPLADQNAIQRHLELVLLASADCGGFKTMFKRVQTFVSYTTRRCWATRTDYPALYSARHQFSSNVKANGFSKQQVAALMGHSSDQTAGRHYGRKTAGEVLDKYVLPVDSEVRNVKQKATKWHQPIISKSKR